MTPGHRLAGGAVRRTPPKSCAGRPSSHSSWVEQRTDSYGRLAFLGDSVLGLSVADASLRASIRDADIGELTKILNQAVSGRACAEVARELGLPEMLAERAPERGRRAAGRDAARLRAHAGLGLRGGDRRLLPGARLRADLRGGGRRVRDEVEQATRERLRLQVGAAGAARARRGDRQLRGRERGGPAARPPLRDPGDASTATRSASAPAAARRRPSRPPRSARSRNCAPSGVASGRRASLPPSATLATCDVSEGHQPEGLQVLPRPHPADLLAGRQRDRRAERLGQVEHHRRGALGARRAEPYCASAASRCAT